VRRHLFVGEFEERGRRGREEEEGDVDVPVDCTFIKDIFLLKNWIIQFMEIISIKY